MKRLLFTALFFVVCACGSSQAHAAGFGFYGSAGGGTADWKDTGSLNSLNFGKDTNHLGFGLVMDTAPARDKLYNYQLNIGYDHFSNRGGSAWGDVDFNGLVISNNFGFGTMISPKTRVWFGPEIRVTWADGNPDKFENYKIRIFGAGIGPVVGINLNYDEMHTLVLKMGFQYSRYVGEGNGNFSHITNTTTTYSNSYTYDVTEKMLYVTVAYLFRTSGDRR